MVALRKPFFVVPAELFQLTASQASPGYPASNAGRLDSVGLIWQCPTASGGGWIRGTMPAGTLVDFLSMVRCSIYSETVYRVRLGNSEAEVLGDNAAYDSQQQPFFVGGNIETRDGRYTSHLELLAPVAATWFHIDIAGPANGWFEVSSLVLGKKIEPSRFYDKDFERGTEDLGSVDLNRHAVPDVTPGAKLRSLNFTLSWLNEAEYEQTFAPFAEVVGTTRVVFCCFDPALSPYRQNRTYLGWLRNPPFARGGAKPRNMAMEFQLRSLI